MGQYTASLLTLMETTQEVEQPATNAAPGALPSGGDQPYAEEYDGSGCQ